MKYTLITLGILLLFSCKNTEGNRFNFINCETLNIELVKELGIDINAQKSRTDSVYFSDNEYYMDLYKQIMFGDPSEQFERAGLSYDLKNIDGKLIQINSDSISNKMKIAFANNMLRIEGQEQSKHYETKLKWYQYMSGKKDAQFSYHFFLSDLKQLYDNEIITESEFQYLILFLHYQGSIENKKL